MLLDRFRYEIHLLGKRVILTPILIMVGFACLAVLLHYLHTDPARTLSSRLVIILPLAAGLFAATTWLHPVFLFPTTLLPLVGPLPQAILNSWLTNRFELIGTALVLLLLGWLLLRNPEGLLKTSSEE